jgi:hypothetical protein
MVRTLQLHFAWPQILEVLYGKIGGRATVWMLWAAILEMKVESNRHKWGQVPPTGQLGYLFIISSNALNTETFLWISLDCYHFLFSLLLQYKFVKLYAVRTNKYCGTFCLLYVAAFFFVCYMLDFIKLHSWEQLELIIFIRFQLTTETVIPFFSPITC